MTTRQIPFWEVHFPFWPFHPTAWAWKTPLRCQVQRDTTDLRARLDDAEAEVQRARRPKDPSGQLLVPRKNAPSSFLLLVVGPGAPSGFLFLVAMPFAPSSFLSACVLCRAANIRS